MKYCEQCGYPLNDEARYCSNCGDLVRAIEEQKPVKRCETCGNKLEDDDIFCAECGEPCCTLDEFEERQMKLAKVAESNSQKSNRETATKESVLDDDNQKGSSEKADGLSAFLLSVCVIMWFVAPFIAINILTLGNQPSALQLILDDVTYIGELTHTIAFWAAITTIIGLLFCLVSAVAASNKSTFVFAIITEIPLIVALLDILSWADDMGEIFEALGLGFWVVFILLIIVMVRVKKS